MTIEQVLQQITTWEDEKGESFVDYSDHLWKPLEWAKFIRTKGFDAFANGIEEGVGINNWYSMNEGIWVYDDNDKNMELFAEWLVSDPKLEEKAINFMRSN